MRMIARCPRPRLLLASACVLSWLAAAQAPLAGAESPLGASATLEGCVTSAMQSERSATFAGEMTAVPGAARMQISIELLERMPGEELYHLVSAPGLGTWRSSATGVKIYTYIKQVTDLGAPAFYRGEVRFRWLNAKDRQIKVAQLRTTRCEQPAAPSSATGTAPTQPGADAPSS